MPRLVLQKSVTVTGVVGVWHISHVSSDLVWVSDGNNLILTNTTGDKLYHLTDILHGGSIHTVTNDGDLIYIDWKYNINKLSTDKKVKSKFIKYTAPWIPRCVYSSSSTGDLLVAMRNTNTCTAKVVRYNSIGEIIQTHKSTGQALYKFPFYITENRNGDIIVSDWYILVVTERGGRHRFSYKGPASGSRLDPLGICADTLSHILACDPYTQTIQILDNKGNFLSKIQTPQYGIDKPCGLSYDEKNHLLWVGSAISNTVNIYRYINDDPLTRIGEVKIHYILISRTSDGVLLSVNTDAKTCSDPEELMRSFNQVSKLLASISARIPDRATYDMEQFTIHMLSALNLTYFVICDNNYSSLLAFAFLDEVQREFLQRNGKDYVAFARRPYALIQFDTTLQKIKQKYNSPRSMHNKFKLSQLQEEIRLRPPHIITPEELRPGGGASVNSTDFQTQFNLDNPKRYRNYLPINSLVVVSILLSGLCAAMNFTRGVAVINEALVEEFAMYHYQNAARFIFCSFLLLFQVYLMCYPHKQRKEFACATLTGVCLCQVYLVELCSNIQILFHVTVACLGTTVIFTRPVQEQLPQYTL